MFSGHPWTKNSLHPYKKHSQLKQLRVFFVNVSINLKVSTYKGIHCFRNLSCICPSELALRIYEKTLQKGIMLKSFKSG